jgi:hypothetical protein
MIAWQELFLYFTFEVSLLRIKILYLFAARLTARYIDPSFRKTAGLSSCTWDCRSIESSFRLQVGPTSYQPYHESSLPAWVPQSSSHPFPPSHQQRTYLWGSHSAQITPSPSALQYQILQPKPQCFNVPAQLPTVTQSSGKNSAHSQCTTGPTITDPTQPQPPTSRKNAKGVAVKVIPQTAANIRSIPTGIRSTCALSLLRQPRAKP